MTLTEERQEVTRMVIRPLEPPVRVHVGWRDILGGTRHACDDCPFARAVRRATGGSYVSVAYGGIYIQSPLYRELIPLPPGAAWRMALFDRTRLMLPLTFGLEAR